MNIIIATDSFDGSILGDMLKDASYIDGTSFNINHIQPWKVIITKNELHYEYFHIPNTSCEGFIDELDSENADFYSDYLVYTSENEINLVNNLDEICKYYIVNID